jgi:hypothetical protein
VRPVTVVLEAGLEPLKAEWEVVATGPELLELELVATEPEVLETEPEVAASAVEPLNTELEPTEAELELIEVETEPPADFKHEVSVPAMTGYA